LYQLLTRPLGREYLYLQIGLDQNKNDFENLSTISAIRVDRNNCQKMLASFLTNLNDKKTRKTQIR